MATDSQKAQEQYELYQYCRVEGGHENYLRDNEVAKRYYASNQWDRNDERERTAAGRLSFTVNETFRTIDAVRGELNQLSSDVRYDPTGADPETARVLNRLSEQVDRENKTFMHDDRIILDGLLGGRGYYRARVRFDDNMQGHIWLGRQRPENVILDYNIESPDPNTWDRVFTTEIVSLDDIASMYGKHISADFDGMPYADWLDVSDRSLPQALGLNAAFHGDFDADNRAFKRHRLINQQYREYKYKDCFVDKQTGDTSEIPENWDREKIGIALAQFDLGVVRKKVKTIRWRVTCNNVVLHDEDSPYNHFDIIPFMPWFLDGMPLSLFRVLKGPQDLLNYTVSEETQILGTTAHSGWKVKQGSLKNRTARQLERDGGKNGLVLELDDVNDAERITPGQPATGFQHFGDRARSWINDLGGVSPSMLGQQSEYANGKNISGNLSRAPVNLHAPLSAFQYMKQLAAEVKLDLFQNFYTETRMMRIATSPYGQTEEIGINVPQPDGGIMYNLSVGKYTTRLMPVGSRMAADEFSFDQLVTMRELGINVPNSLFVATSALNAKSDVMEQLLAANGGEISPEEQEAKRLELEAMQLANEKDRAQAFAHEGAGNLANARASKAQREAMFDKDGERARLDAARLQSEHARGMAQIDHQRQKDATQAAIAVTKIAADASKPQPKPVSLAKKAAKKTAKKTTKKTTKKQPR